MSHFSTWVIFQKSTCNKTANVRRKQLKWCEKLLPREKENKLESCIKTFNYFIFHICEWTFLFPLLSVEFNPHTIIINKNHFSSSISFNYSLSFVYLKRYFCSFSLPSFPPFERVTSLSLSRMILCQVLYVKSGDINAENSFD